MQNPTLVAVHQPVQDLPHNQLDRGEIELAVSIFSDTSQVMLHIFKHHEDIALVVVLIGSFGRHDLLQSDDILVADIFVLRGKFGKNLDLAYGSDGETCVYLFSFQSAVSP